MENKNVIVFILSFIILATVGIIFVFMKGAQTAPFVVPQPQPQPPPTPTAQTPADWKTFKDERMGYEVKYPPDFRVQGEGNFVVQKGSGAPIFSVYPTNTFSLDVKSIKGYESENEIINIVPIRIFNQIVYKAEFKNASGREPDIYFVKNLLDGRVLEIIIEDKDNTIAKEIFSSFRLIK